MSYSLIVGQFLGDLRYSFHLLVKLVQTQGCVATFWSTQDLGEGTGFSSWRLWRSRPGTLRAIGRTADNCCGADEWPQIRTKRYSPSLSDLNAQSYGSAPGTPINRDLSVVLNEHISGRYRTSSGTRAAVEHVPIAAFGGVSGPEGEGGCATPPVRPTGLTGACDNL